MQYDPTNPLIVQGDRTVLVEVDNPPYVEARDALAPFADLEKSPEHIHTYRLTDLSLWNAAAAGLSADAMLDVLKRYAKYPVPPNILSEIPERVGRYGRVKLLRLDPSPPTPLPQGERGRGEGGAAPSLRLLCPDLPL